MTYWISRRIVLLGALPAACGLAQPARNERTARQAPARTPAPIPSAEPVVDVRNFGASPTASAFVNSAAFLDASRAIERAGGGTLYIPAGTYRVGVQERRGARARVPTDIIRIAGCRRPVVVSGAGATLKAADGLYFGAFDPREGRRHDAPQPSRDLAYRVDAPVMVHVSGCSGSVHVAGLRLDGNLAGYVLGGQWGDTGRQVNGDGLILEGNTGPVTVADIVSANHGRDGIMLIHYGLTPRSPRYPVVLTDVTCDGNGRQGLSWIGGTQLTVTRGRFTRTGRGKVYSAPGAGVDVEAESSVCRNGRFVDCKFIDNSGIGFVADSGDSMGIVLENCEFIGTTNWSAWPRKPGIVFHDCLFVGSIVNVHGDADPRRATQFYKCRFHADPALSPTRAVFGPYLADLGAGARNVLMQGCDFWAKAPDKALPWTPADIRYDNCLFRQTGKAISYPRGIFTGRTSIDSAGKVELWGSVFQGPVVLNGRALG